MIASLLHPGKKRILFVDDEQAVLKSIEYVLRRDRERWEMVFAVGGQRALEELRASCFDAVVTDMRMPDIDGAALLTAVMEECPATARILLTGYSDGDELARVQPAVDELLSKPCGAKALREAIVRNLDARATDRSG